MGKIRFFIFIFLIHIQCSNSRLYLEGIVIEPIDLNSSTEIPISGAKVVWKTTLLERSAETYTDSQGYFALEIIVDDELNQKAGGANQENADLRSFDTFIEVSKPGYSKYVQPQSSNSRFVQKEKIVLVKEK